MNNQSFDVQRIAEGYAKRPWLHKEVINQIKKDCNIESFENGLDVGCGAGLSSKALKLICNHVTGTDISSEMISVCQRIYKDDAYHFYVCKAEESRIPKIPYDIITAAGVINWVERKPFLQNADKVLKEHGLIVIYDFWITDQMLQSEKYTDWYRKQYLQRFPKPPRKENVWTQSDLPETFIMEKQITYQMEYEFLMDEFIDFMMIQSNVNEKLENGEFSVSEVREWMTQGLQGIFDGKTRSLMFQGYSWYIRKRSC